MNEYGVSLIESLLTVAIIMLIAGSLVPLHSKLNQSLYQKKTELHASEVAYQGALQVARGDSINGSIEIEGIMYNWQYENARICVSFHHTGKGHVKCIGSQDGT